MTGEVVLGEAVITVKEQFTGKVKLVAIIPRVFFYSQFE
jgi:hypothetical protein